MADVAFDGSTYLVVWRAGGQIRAARLSTTAALLDATPIVIDEAAPNGPVPSVAAGASGFLVWWMSALGGRHARVATDGSVLDVPAIESMLGRPDIGFDGSSFLAVLGANGRRIAATGELLGETFPLSSAKSSFSRVASKSGEHLVVWDTDTGTLATAIDIRARRVAGDGALLGPGELTLALAANAQEAPVVTSNGSDFLLAWRDHRKQEPALFFQRIAADGSALDPVATELTLSKLEQRDFAATFDGSQYLVAWHDAADHLLAARVDVLGNVIDTNAIVVADEPGRRVSAASNAQSSFVVWERKYSVPADIVGVRVSSSGELLDSTEIVIASGPGEQAFPAIASDGADYLVVWSDALSQEIRASLYAADGAPLTPSPVVVSSAPASRFAPRVAFGNGIYLIAWEDDRNVTSGSGRDVYAARVSSAGTLLDPDAIAIGTAAGADHRVDVVWNVGAFVVSWTAASELRAARVEPSGAVLDPGGFLVAASGPAEAPARLAANGSSTALIGYARYDDAAKIDASRVKTRQIGFVEAPDASADAGDAAPPDAAAVNDADVPDAPDAEHDAAVPLTPSPRTTEDGGCGCRAARSAAASQSWTALAIALAFAFASGRRRREVVHWMTRFTR